MTSLIYFLAQNPKNRKANKNGDERLRKNSFKNQKNVSVCL
jgi:hypothetical protein